MKLYVGNLPWKIDNDALKELFAAYDVEEATLITDKFSGRSKGFGFVTIADDAKAKEAIAEMNEKEIEGRPLTVSEAKPMVPRDDAPRYDAKDSGSNEAPIADSSAINDAVEDSIEDEAAPEVVDNNSDAEANEEDIETVEEAKDDAEADAPASEEVTKKPKQSSEA